MGEISLMDKLLKSYEDKEYSHAMLATHKGTVIAFAQDENCQIYHAVLDVDSQNEEKYLDVDCWPMEPVPLQFPREIERVGYSLAGVTAMPTVKKDARIESTVPLRKNEIDPFLSSTSRLTAPTTFRVFSDNKYVFLFRQSIASDDVRNVYKLKSGESSANPDTALEKFVVTGGGEKIPLVSNTLLCDRFVLNGKRLVPSREVRFQRSRHRTIPSSASDSLGAKDMDGTPFYTPTQELAFVNEMRNGWFDILQLPTTISTLKRWLISSYNKSTRFIDMFNVEVGRDGMFNMAGTKLFTSPDRTYRDSVLERNPGNCPFTGLPLVQIPGMSTHAKTALSFDTNSYVTTNSPLWNTTEFSIEIWAKASVNETSSVTRMLFSSTLGGSTENTIQIKQEGGNYVFWHPTVQVAIGAVQCEWQHLAVTYGEGILTSYLNGNIRTVKLNHQMTSKFESYVFGAQLSGSSSFHGEIDEMRIWSSCLQQVAIQGQKEIRLDGQEESLKAYWTFDEGYGPKLYDSIDSSVLGILTDVHWVCSSCPVTSFRGFFKTRLKGKDQELVGGFSTKLYYEQEDAITGYTSESKPMKKQARVLLVMNVSAGGGPGNLFYADMAVSREGRTALTPEVLDGKLVVRDNTPEAVDLASLEATKRNLQDDIESLQLQIEETHETERNRPAGCSNYTNDLQRQQEADDYVQFLETNRFSHFYSIRMGSNPSNRHYWHFAPGTRTQTYKPGIITDDSVRGEGLLLGDMVSFQPGTGSNWTFNQGSETFDEYLTRLRGTGWSENKVVILIGVHSQRILARYFGSNAASGYPNAHTCRTDAYPGLDTQDQPSEHFQWILHEKGPFFSIENVYTSTAERYYLHMQIGGGIHQLITFNVWNTENSKAYLTKGASTNAYNSAYSYREAANAAVAYHEAVLEAQTLRATLTAQQLIKIASLNAVDSQIATITNGIRSQIRIPTETVHVDSDGLSSSAGNLSFMKCEGIPTIQINSTGRLSVLFHDRDRNMMASHLDTKVRRTVFRFEGSFSPVQFVSRSSGNRLNSAVLAILDGSTDDSCTLRFEGNDQGNEHAIREIWTNLPRDATELAMIFNGSKSRPSQVTVEVFPKRFNVQRSSSQLLAVVNPKFSARPVPNGEATVSPGELSNWVADAPGGTYYFSPGSEILSLGQNQLDNMIPTDSFTVESWVNPVSNDALPDFSRIIHYAADECAYMLGLRNEDSGVHVIAARTSGSSSNHRVAKYIRSKETIEPERWTHLAMTCRQGYGIRLNNKSYIDCGNNAMLDITGDITIEMFLVLHDLDSSHGLIGKGVLGDQDKRVPYQVLVERSGNLVFVYEDKSGKIERLESTKALEVNKFHRIAIVRTEGQKKQEQKGTTPIKYKDEEGKTKTRTIDMVTTVTLEKFMKVSLFIDSEECGSAIAAIDEAVGNKEPLEIGRCHLSGVSRLQSRATVAEVRLWKRSLKKSELAATLQGKEDQLIAWWDMNDNVGNIAKDKGKGFDGRISHAVWTRSPNPDDNVLKIMKNGCTLGTIDLTEISNAIIPNQWGKNSFSLGGCVMSGQNQDLFRGSLEEVRVWHVPRTEEQILDNLFARVTGEKGDLVACYNFDYDTMSDNALVYDTGLRGNHLNLPAQDSKKPDSMLSTAPISSEAPLIRCSISGIETQFHQTSDYLLSSSEYSDIQYDEFGDLKGVLKKCYSYVQGGKWTLLTGYKVGSLILEWAGQAQFDPQIYGYVEGAPPVPSENLTAGVCQSADDAGVVTVRQSESVLTTVASGKEGSCDLGFEASASLEMGLGDQLITAPLGIGMAIELANVNVSAEVGGRFDVSESWSQEESQGLGTNYSRSLRVATGGGFESIDTTGQRNPEIGRRCLIANSGFALVQSATADLYALRFAENNALISYKMVPNKDIPKDWNIVTFPINPLYSKQGTLDGRLGFDQQGRVVMESPYPPTTQYREYSYFKPKEAYAKEREIRKAEQANRSYYENFSTSYGSTMGKVAGAAAGAVASLMVPGAGPLLAQASLAAGMSVVGDTIHNSGLEETYAKRDIVNTYVWTADGGFFSESTENTEVQTDVSSGSFSFSGSIGGGVGVEVEVFSVGFQMEMEAAVGGGMSVTKTKSKESETTFGLDIEVSVPGDLNKYQRNNNSGRYEGVYDENGDPVSVPGKVDAYRFKTFYLDASSENFDDLFGKVIDPIWLSSDHPNAIALRQAKQAEKKPPCYRVFHRVTFVSRILPEFADPTSAPFESALKAANVDSNWQLIRKLEPFVKGYVQNPVAFGDEVRRVIATHLPLLVPKTLEIIAYLKLYYGMEI